MSNSTATLAQALGAETEKLLGCIHCGLCLPACPTYLQLGNENDSPRGRIYLMRAVNEGRLEPQSHAFERHIDLCLGCRACETACPAGVRYGSLLEAAREEVRAHQRARGRGLQKGLQKRLLDFALRRVFPYPARLRRALGLLAWLRRRAVVRLASQEGLLEGLSPQADFALALLLATAPEGPARGAEMVNEEAVARVRKSARREATVFTGCVMDGLFRHVNEATARVLEVNGSRLTPVEEQVCCGALHAHAGDLEEARALARRNIDAFSAAKESTIVVNAAGCGALLKEYGELLKDDPRYAAPARALSARVRDVTEFLAAGGAPRAGAPLETVATYDAPCHLYHAQRVTTAPQQLLAAIPGIRYVPLEGMADCCGGAGTYNLSEPEMSARLLDDKLKKVRATGAEVLVTANPGCHMQLGAGVRLGNVGCRVAHVVELLDESYRRAGFYSQSSAPGL
jgi:glycolate oxidase iron-sulfur subunit